MTTDNVTELHSLPSPAKGEGPKRDATAAVRARRYRRRQRASVQGDKRKAVTAPAMQAEIQKFEKPNDFKAAVTVGRDATVTGEKANKSKAVTPFVHPTRQDGAVTAARTGIDAIAYAAAIALAGCAAWFSIRGMVVLFPGAPLAIVAMAVAMEGGKLITAGWLASRWQATAWIWRVTLVALVTGLDVINATGVYAQLVAAHVGDRGATAARLETQDAEIAARIEVASHAVADLDQRLRQIDSAVEEAAKRGRTVTALNAMEGQRKGRASLVGERQREASTLADLKAERAALVAKGHQVEVEAAPIRYVAELVGDNADSERAIRWLIALMVLCCDPLAIALTAAASAKL